MKLPFVQIDAFADRPFGGNPAAVMPLDAWLPDDVLQAIALENNLSETAFTIPAEGDADYELRWFTPACEVALCGHATFASGHHLIGDRERVRFRTRKAGVLTVRRAGDGYAMELPATFMSPQPRPEIAAALGVPDAPTWASATDAAEETVIVLLKDEAAVRALEPDFRALGRHHVMVVPTAPGTNTDVVSRVFVPSFGIDEDPVTGSAHAALAPFWAERLGRPSFTAFQASARGGRVDCTLAGDRAVLGGRSVTVIEGSFFL
ncbi:PhzF family phenazine biosynthesis protein [Sphingomonas sp.]|jgi:PhzF family phenazine biosynthesis protein|uniref:PhzF family phenazine biosynthesis protein n=1 Tax=Sphingomonas sp. TaxID=28214 RepID=UPI002DF05C01|nr:PhzF family phenazine biosynthesis protein [Sphingomonas sp.]